MSILIACALIAVVAAMIPLNCIQKYSHGCPLAHKKMAAKQCLRDSITPSGATDIAGLPASGPHEPQNIPACNTEVRDFSRSIINARIDASPLRC
jgi:hypothetical protein